MFELLGLAGKLSDLPFKIADVLKFQKQLRRNVQAINQLLVLECTRNLVLLESIDLDGQTDLDPLAEDLRHLIDSLETRMLDMYLSATDLGSAARDFNEEFVLPNAYPEEEKGTISFLSAGKAARFIYIRLFVLKVLVGGKAKSPGSPALKKIRLRPRLKNLRTAMQKLSGHLMAAKAASK